MTNYRGTNDMKPQFQKSAYEIRLETLRLAYDICYDEKSSENNRNPDSVIDVAEKLNKFISTKTNPGGNYHD